MMREVFTIGEISQLLNVSTPALRFWEQKGLFSVNKSSNRYRKYDMGDLIRIAGVVFYRNLGIPIKDLGRFQDCTLPQYQEGLDEVQSHLEEKLEEYQRMYRYALRQQQRLEELKALMAQEYLPEEVPFEGVAPFDFREKDKLHQYTSDPSSYVRYFDTRNMSSETRGIIVPGNLTGVPLLWRKKPGRSFVTFLIRENADDDYRSDVQEKLIRVRKEYSSGVMLAQFLLTAMEGGNHIDFFKAYLEVGNKKTHEFTENTLMPL